jgi:hypothetical protein
MSNHRSLLLRSNRVLGATLVEHNLVNIEHLEAANERLFELLKNGVSRQSSLLGVLLGEMGSVSETDLIDFATREYGLGLIDLADHVISDECRAYIEPELTWATWAIPFDYEDGFYFVATSYYLSIAVREYWADRLDGSIIWYATSMESLAGAVERLAEEAKQA